MLEGGAGRSLDRLAGFVAERDRAGDPVGAVLAYLDRRRANAVPVDLGARLDLVDREAERTGGAVADGTDNLGHATAARSDEHAFGVEDAVEPVGTEAGVLTDAAVVVDGELHAVVGVALVGDALGILLVAKVGPGTGAVAVRLERRLAAAAESHLRP